jgi:hypothetical protein
MIYFLTTIGLTLDGSSTVHIYTQTVHRTTQNKQYIEQHKNFENNIKCGQTDRQTCLQRRVGHKVEALFGYQTTRKGNLTVTRRQYGACALHAVYPRLETRPQNMKYLLLLNGNNGHANALHCYFIRALPVLFTTTETFLRGFPPHDPSRIGCIWL